MTPPITIVERTTRVGVLGHLDELERLMREYKEVRISENSPTDDMLRDLYLSSFLYWLQQRERQLVAGEKVSYDYEGRDPMCSAGKS